MNAARMGVLVLAVVAAGLAALLARGLMKPGADDAPKVAEAPSVEVLVASTDIERGRRLTSGSLRWQSWPSGALTPNFVTRTQRPDAIAAFSNTLARQAIANGEPVTEAKIVDPQKGGLMSALITPGMRAVAVSITPETGAGGFILPNDRVDVILTRRVQERAESGFQDQIRGETIMTNIRVLAVDQDFKADGRDAVAVGKTATLELTALQAESLAVAQAQGTVLLSLRGIGETGDQVVETQHDSEGNVVRVVRYGAEKTVRVK